MKYLILLLFPLFALGQELVNVTLSWDANLEPDVSGYKLYVGTSSQNYSAPIPVTGITKTLSLPKDTLHFAVVTAVNTSGLESTVSSELCFQVFRAGEGKIPSAPTGLHKAGGLSVSLEKSSDLKIWQTIYRENVIASVSEFYRVQLVSQ